MPKTPRDNRSDSASKKDGPSSSGTLTKRRSPLRAKFDVKIEGRSVKVQGYEYKSPKEDTTVWPPKAVTSPVPKNQFPWAMTLWLVVTGAMVLFALYKVGVFA